MRIIKYEIAVYGLAGSKLGSVRTLPCLERKGSRGRSFNPCIDGARRVQQVPRWFNQQHIRVEVFEFINPQSMCWCSRPVTHFIRIEAMEGQQEEA
jgi:hypothetical protein